MDSQLKQKLEEMRTALSEATELDDEAKHQLRQLENDIQEKVGGNAIDDLEERLEEQAVAFEGDFPKLSAIVRDVVDVLGKMGI